MTAGGYQNQRHEFIQVGHAPAVTCSIKNKSLVTATRVTKDQPGHGIVSPAVEDAFGLAVWLHNYTGDLWVDGKKNNDWGRKGSFAFFDFRQGFVGNCVSSFDFVGFHIPRPTIDALEEDLAGVRVDTLSIPAGTDVDDATVFGITQALMPSFLESSNTSSIFTDTVGLALSIHLCTTYGRAPKMADVHAGGLAPWQVKRALEIIDANLDGDVSIIEMAAACGLPPGYFTRAFKLVMGVTPYRWVSRRRVERANKIKNGQHLAAWNS